MRTKKPTFDTPPRGRVKIAPNGWKCKPRRYGFVKSYDPVADTVTVFGRYNLAMTETFAAKLVVPDPEEWPRPETRDIHFTVEHQEAVCDDVPERFVLKAEYHGITNTYYCQDEAEVFNWMRELYLKPICKVCGCQLAQTSRGRVTCQRAIEHAHGYVAPEVKRDSWGNVRGDREVPLPEIKPAKATGWSDKSKLPAYEKKIAALWTNTDKLEAFSTGDKDRDGRPVAIDRKLINRRLPFAACEELDAKRYKAKKILGVPIGGVFPHCNYHDCLPPMPDFTASSDEAARYADYCRLISESKSGVTQQPFEDWLALYRNHWSRRAQAV